MARGHEGSVTRRLDVRRTHRLVVARLGEQGRSNVPTSADNVNSAFWTSPMAAAPR